MKKEPEMENPVGTPPPVPNTPPPVPGKTPKKKSTGSKVLIGFGIGCGTLFVLGLILAGIGIWWVFSTGDQVATDKILHSNAKAVFKVGNVSASKGATQLISHIFREFQRVNREQTSAQLPALIRKMQQYSDSQSDPAMMLKFFSPKEMTVSMTFDESGTTHYVVAANPKIGTRIIRTFVKMVAQQGNPSSENIISTPHGSLYVIDPQHQGNQGRSRKNVIGFHKGMLISSDGIQAVITAMEQLSDKDASGRVPMGIAEPYHKLSREEWLAFCAVDGDMLEQTDFAQGIIPGNLRSEVERISAAIRIPSGNDMVVNIYIDWRSREISDRMFNVVEEQKNRWIDMAEKNRLELRVESALTYRQQVIKLYFGNLEMATTEYIRAQIQFQQQ